jgi:hypothetical protein
MEAICLPPASEGDVLRALGFDPHVIVLIDGAFRRVPAVWHKEILYALACGVHVIGAASMGALRAVELAIYGMVGVGRVFQLFQSGELEDDDEVAVAHAPAELDFQPLSLAMVDVRCALQTATARSEVSVPAAAGAVRVLKGRPYDARTLSVLEEALQMGAAELAPALVWLRKNLGSQKREDAIEALALVRDNSEFRERRFQPDFKLQTTSYWRRAAAEAGGFAPGSSEPVSASEILDELRLKPRLYVAIEREARWKTMARALGGRVQANGESVAAALARFRSARGITADVDLEAWLRQQMLGREEFEHLLKRDFAAVCNATAAQWDIQAGLLDEVRLAGLYGDLAGRAVAKRRMLEEAETHEVDSDAALHEAFRREHGLTSFSPDSLARALGLSGADALSVLLCREHSFRAAADAAQVSQQAALEGGTS